MKEIDLKQTYNKLLQRYYNGCNYLDEHPDEEEKYEPVVLGILDKMNKILDRIPDVTEKEGLYGFKT